MKINELYNDVLNEDTQYEFKAKIHYENNIKWAKPLWRMQMAKAE